MLWRKKAAKQSVNRHSDWLDTVQPWFVQEYSFKKHKQPNPSHNKMTTNQATRTALWWPIIEISKILLLIFRQLKGLRSFKCKWNGCFSQKSYWYMHVVHKMYPRTMSRTIQLANNHKSSKLTPNYYHQQPFWLPTKMAAVEEVHHDITMCRLVFVEEWILFTTARIYL